MEGGAADAIKQTAARVAIIKLDGWQLKGSDYNAKAAVNSRRIDGRG
jgi:hypothetical protein